MVFNPWAVSTCLPKDDKAEPNTGEFFASLDFDRREEYLVRESFQNSWDAAVRGASDPVRIRVFVSGKERALAPEIASKYFHGLKEHLEACKDLSGDWGAILGSPCEFLVIEDFGTTGLTGDERAGIHEEGVKNAFYHFWRTSGRTDKGNDPSKAGSFGIGKYVYIMSSELRAMFGFTVRDGVGEDVRSLLFGQAALKFHTINGKMYSRLGYFGVEPKNDDVVAPYSGEEARVVFSKDWRLRRNGESGLSVVVPYCKALDSDALLFSIVKEYGFNIIRNRIKVEIDAPDVPPVILERSNLQGEVRKRSSDPEWSELGLVLDLLDSHHGAPNDGFLVLPTIDHPRDWKDIFSSLPEVMRDEMTDRFRKKGELFVRVPVSIKRANGGREDAWFDVLIKEAESSVPIAPLYYRAGLRISGKQMGSKSNGVRSIFIADEGILAELLRAAEGPAHTEWTGSREKFVGKYTEGERWIRLCRTAPKMLVEQARASTVEDDFVSLADMFPDADSPDLERMRRPKGTAGPGPGPHTPETPPGPGPAEQSFRIDPLKDGFSLKLGKDLGKTYVWVEFAYSCTRGNPFKNWSPSDFTASGLAKTTSVSGGEVIERVGNGLLVRVDRPKTFRLNVAGFDRNRDIEVRAMEREVG